ncbi:MAG: Peptidoglycan glycosyltransferase [Pedosphaera sp.]|nr:Peptidoglycan glycosyltransferase [Pedosphaera sp.]
MLALLLGVAFAGLGYRLVDLQILRHADLQSQARENTRRTFQFEPRRGDILDAKGNLLATSIFVKTVCADPILIGNHQAEVAHAIAPLLQLKEAELAQRLMPRTRQDDKGEIRTNRYVVLKRKVSAETWQKIQETMAQLSFAAEENITSKKEKAFYNDLRAKAIYPDSTDDQLRTYPNLSLAAHVLGFVGMTERTNRGARFLETVGVDGIERTLNSKLSGVRGWRQTEVDRQRRELVYLREQNIEPHDGLNAVLTIDSGLQHILESALADAMQKESPNSISGMIVRPRTGEILAMAVFPNFDPNSPGDNADARRNRIISDMNEPGSTFKIVVVSGALNDQIVKLTDQFDCEHGRFHYAGRSLHDHAAYGVLSTEGIISKSSNIGAAKIGIKMGEPRLYQYIRDFGFGAKTGIPLPGEIGGWVHPVKEWSKVSIAQLPMGQGLTATSLQMAMAMSAIANKGMLMQPMLVDRLQDQDGNVVVKYAPVQARKVVSEDVSRQMIEALKTVATTDGTAPKAAMEHYTVAGKTGTAQKVEKGHYINRFYASFVGFFPADNAEICIYVSLDDPKSNFHQGGQVAAPVFKQIAEKAANYLNIRPDRGVETGLQDVLVTNGGEKTPKAVVSRVP